MFALMGCKTSTPFSSETSVLPEEVYRVEQPKTALKKSFLIPGGVFAFSNSNEIYFVDQTDKSVVHKRSLSFSDPVKEFIDLKEWLKIEDTKEFKIDDIWIDAQQRILLAESVTGKILRISKDARKLENLADSYDGYRFSKIQGLIGSLNGEIFVGSPNSATIYRIDPTKGKLSVLNENLVRSNDFTITKDRLLVAETAPNRIVVYDFNKSKEMLKSWKLIHFTSRDDRPSSIDFLDQDKNFLSVLLQGRKKLQVFDLRNGELFKQIDLPTRCFRIRAHDNWIYLQTKKGIIRKEIPSFK